MQYIKSLLTNGYFYGGLALLFAVGATVFLLFDRALMPAITRHDAATQVPNVMQLHIDDATAALERANLVVDARRSRFRPEYEKDVVTDQYPSANTFVKPGRRITITVNSGTVPTVKVPDVVTRSLRQAKNEILNAGLVIEAERRDPIPAPDAQTVTRTDPPAGTVVDKGSPVVIWYSTGPGNISVTVPDVTGMTVSEARGVLLNVRLRSRGIGVRNAATQTVKRQSVAAGATVTEGSEIRLYVRDPSTASNNGGD